MSILSDETNIKTAVGLLLMRADELTKRVLTAFDPSAKRSANIKALNSFNLDILEPCANFLGINLSDSEENKLFTKESLINRIILGIRALLPSQCSDCNQQYTVVLDSEVPPVFTCHMCYQGSHDCDTIKSLHSALGSTSTKLLSGHVWLCSECHGSSIPVKLRKSKSRHNSVSRNDTLSRIRDELQNLEVESTANEPPGPVVTTEPNALVNSELQSELSIRVRSLTKVNICQKYKSGKCPNGVRGNKLVNGSKCEKEHPKRCFKYCRYGDKHRHGCKEESSCEYFHPSLCKFSVQKRICTNKDCTFVHLKGTRRNESNPDQTRKYSRENDHTLANKKSRTIQVAKNGQGLSEKECSSIPDHFLELKGLVQSMQANFFQEISAIKASLLCPRPTSYPNFLMPQHQSIPPHSPIQLMGQYQQQVQPSTSVQMPGTMFIPQSSF